MRRLLTTSLASVMSGVFWFAAAPSAHAETVIELYTSHGCSSCPPAEALFNDLIKEDESLIALEFHVDYWNKLVHGNAGNFVDPFSNAKYSERQRRYNARKLKGRRGVYTPQAVINGQYAAVGSNRGRIKAALEKSIDSGIAVSISAKDSVWQVAIENDGSNKDASDALVWIVRYQKTAVTEITGGENKGLKLENHNVVVSMDPIGGVPKQGSVVLDAALDQDAGMGCAVLVQDDFQSPILAAAKCPEI